MTDPSTYDDQPEYSAGGRLREPVKCPMCDESFVVKSQLQAHLAEGHKYSPKVKQRKVKTTRAKYMPVEKNNAFGASFWLAAGAVFGIVVLIGLTAPQLIRFILPVGLFALFLTRAGLFRK